MTAKENAISFLQENSYSIRRGFEVNLEEIKKIDRDEQKEKWNTLFEIRDVLETTILLREYDGTVMQNLCDTIEEDSYITYMDCVKHQISFN